MRHCFLINPSAGKGRPVKLMPVIEEVCGSGGLDYEIYQAKGKEDAIRYCADATSGGNPVRLYAVGGDGTLNEALNGISDFENTTLVSVSCGTGNDFIKTFGTNADTVTDISKAVTAREEKVDFMTVSGKRCLNICNVGLDSNAAFYMQELKKLPFMKGSLPYFFGVLKSLCGDPSYKLELTLDGEHINGNFMLVAFANGQYYGGAYRAAPLADLHDGLLDVCLVSKVSRLRVIKQINEYKAGMHIDSPKFSDILTYRKAKKITAVSDKPIRVCLDGEVMTMADLNIEVVPSGLKIAAAK